MSVLWYSGCGRIELEFESLEQAQSCSHPGPCDQDVLALSVVMAGQLAKVDPQVLRSHLRGFGAWEDDELQDHAQNLQRLLWSAACDVAEGDYE